MKAYTLTLTENKQTSKQTSKLTRAGGARNRHSQTRGLGAGASMASLQNSTPSGVRNRYFQDTNGVLHTTSAKGVAPHR